MIDTISTPMGNKGIYAIDRGGDRGELYNKFLEEWKLFFIRLTQKRDLIHKGLKRNGLYLATVAKFKSFRIGKLQLQH